MENRTHPGRILLVEDDMISAIPLINMLNCEGCEILHAGDGETAVRLIENGKLFDFILMDVNLGTGISGIDAAKKIINICGVPVIFLTSYSKREVDSMMGEYSEYGYISKLASSIDEIKSILEIIKRSNCNSYIMKKILASSDRTVTLRPDY